jgi:hypothetical protein
MRCSMAGIRIYFGQLADIYCHDIRSLCMCCISYGTPSRFHCRTVFCPAAMASKSARRSRKLPGSNSIFCSNPALVIRQSVARLTPSSFADAVIPRSRGPVVSFVFSRIPSIRMLSIALICSGEAANNRFSLSSMYMCVDYVYVILYLHVTSCISMMSPPMS